MGGVGDGNEARELQEEKAADLEGEKKPEQRPQLQADGDEEEEQPGALLGKVEAGVGQEPGDAGRGADETARQCRLEAEPEASPGEGGAEENS